MPSAYKQCAFFVFGPGPGKSLKALRFGALDVTKPYKFIGIGALGVTKPYEFIGIGAMDVTKPYEFIGIGAMDVTKPYEFIGIGAIYWGMAVGRLGSPGAFRRLYGTQESYMVPSGGGGGRYPRALYSPSFRVGNNNYNFNCVFWPVSGRTWPRDPFKRVGLGK